MARSGKNKFALGLFFGSLVGGISALLFAPKSGAKLRKDISKKYDKVSDKTQDLIENVSEQAEELFEKAKCIAEDAKDAASQFMKKRK